VRGILVTEGVRGEGGVLRNRLGRRFMFDDVPDLYKSQTADTEEEGWRYCQGDKTARRPPELLTRDHVARCIVREIKEGRGSEHGGVLLDISWIASRMPHAAEHIRKKLPSMYHQFKELAGIDITREPMEIGPTTHYMMGGVRVDAESQMSTVPGLFAAGECAAGLHGANRLGGNSLSDLLVFGKRAGEHAARFAGEHGREAPDPAQIDAAVIALYAPLDRQASGGEVVAAGAGAAAAPGAAAAEAGPYQIQRRLQVMMQAQVGIVRRQDEMESALARIGELERQAAAVAVGGNREYNPGWHTALDLHNLLTVAAAVTRAALERRESRGAQFRDDFPGKDEALGKVNVAIRKGAGGEMTVTRVPLVPASAEQRRIIEEAE